jgi:transposase
MPPITARLLDPTFEAIPDPFYGYDKRQEPLPDRLYLPCGIDPGKKECGVAFLHPLPAHDEVLAHKTIRNCHLEDAQWLLASGNKLADPFGATPAYVFESTNNLWRPLWRFVQSQGGVTATVAGRQTAHSRSTKTRKAQNDFIDAKNIAKVFKDGYSHASRSPKEPIASLREYERLHLFVTEFAVAIQNRMNNIRFDIFPEFDGLFCQDKTLATTLALMRSELVHPQKLLAASPEALFDLVHQASHGKLGDERVQAILRAAENTFALPYAVEGFSFGLKLLADIYAYLEEVILPALKERIVDCLARVPFQHYLDEIPYFGPIVIGTLLGELGDPAWFPTVDSVVAWFGLDPAVSESCHQPSGPSHLTKRGTKYGRRMMWLVARNWAQYRPEGRDFFKRQVYAYHRSYDAGIVMLAAKLLRAAYAMLRDGSHFDLDKLF